MFDETLESFKKIAAERAAERTVCSNCGWFAAHKDEKIGMCGEVFLTAFAAYAQCVEGLECEDKGYEASDDAREWFAQRAVRDSQIANDPTAVR